METDRALGRRLFNGGCEGRTRVGLDFYLFPRAISRASPTDVSPMSKERELGERFGEGRDWRAVLAGGSNPMAIWEIAADAEKGL
ncbi:hypothetical protein MRX96_021254 [Rhipicephalus microplus]